MVDGGLLIIAAADTGALVPAQRPVSAGSAFAWSPDGNHIAWVQARSDVSPVAVNVLAIDGASAPVATDTNAFSVTYARDGQTILFTNGDASGPDSAEIPFAVRTGGIYSVAASAAGAKPSTPTAVFARQGFYYSDIAALESGAIGFTAQGGVGSSKTIQILDKGSSLPRTTVTDVDATAEGPAWGAGDFIAYLSTSPESSLVVTDLDDRSPRQVDKGVDTFAWAPPSR